MSVYEGEWAAFQTLERIWSKGAYLNLAMAEVFDEQNPDPKAKAMATALVRTTLENCIAIDYALQTITDTKRCGRAVNNILRLAAARMLYMHTSDASIVNAAVEMCKKAGKGKQSGYVNGVLRKLSATRLSIPWPVRENDFRRYLSVRYSYPLWAVDQAERQLGYDGAEMMMRCTGQDYVSVRVNRLKADVDDVKTALIRAGGSVATSPLHPLALRVCGLSNITALPEYRGGLLSMQSEASIVFADQIPDGCQKVMDLCAAPGGKTCAIAERLPAAQILSYDIHPHRVELIQKQAQRLGLTNIAFAVQDARVRMEQHLDSADAVLVDAPCSGLGTAAKRPDVKLNRSFDDVLALSLVQRAILETASAYVKKGGVLAYGTCTFVHQENGAVVEGFLQDHPNFVLVAVALPNGFARTDQPGMLQLWPHLDGTDGFFMARMRRIG